MLNRLYFQWPWAFTLLLIIPIWWVLYVRYYRHQLRKKALEFSRVALIQQLSRQSASWKRLFLPTMVSFLMATLILALSRPTMNIQTPVNSLDIMVVLDISLSMMAEDIQPNRIDAARNAAIRFIDSLPSDVRVGLELFAGDNFVLSPPVTQHDTVESYLRALTVADLKPRTEIGSAIRSALTVLKNDQTPEKGKHTPDRVIVVLSDGDSHEGYPWDQAAQEARQQKVMIYTVGIGSPTGAFIHYRGMDLPVSFDESILRQVATLGGGEYFRVFKDSDFHRIVDQIHTRTVHYESRSTDLAYIAAGLSLLLLVGGLAFWMKLN